MALDIPGGLFGDKAEKFPIEERASLGREAGIMAIFGHAKDYTSYYAISPAQFTSLSPDTDNIRQQNTRLRADEDGKTLYAPINLPNGATVTAVILYGNTAAEAEIWFLTRKEQATTTSVDMASANFNSEDTSITNPVIDNSLFNYGIRTSSLDTSDEIYGGRITYTTGSIVPNLNIQIAAEGKAYPLTAEKPKGYKTYHTLFNQTGAEQTVSFTIKNLTKGTTLLTLVDKVIPINSAIHNTHIWSTEEISSGDNIEFEMYDGFIGTAGDALVLGYLDWKVESIEETREAT